jgi:hypothetical protein
MPYNPFNNWKNNSYQYMDIAFCYIMMPKLFILSLQNL